MQLAFRSSHQADRSAKQKMKMCIITSLLILTGTACLANDAISKLVEGLNSTNSIGNLWVNGAQPSFKLASNSTPNEVVTAAAYAWRKIETTNDTVHIIEIRPVDISGPLGSQWMAAEIEVKLSKMILLYRSTGDDRWWTRFYDIK